MKHYHARGGVVETGKRRRTPTDRVLFLWYSAELHAEVERARAAMEADLGVPVSMSAAVRLLLETAIEREFPEEG